MSDTEDLVITKAPKHSGVHPSHGVWKLAYADFVTAMMAFFMLLWILNFAVDDDISGVSIFYAPKTTSTAHSGFGKEHSGLDKTTEEGWRISTLSKRAERSQYPTFGEESKGDAEGTKRESIQQQTTGLALAEKRISKLKIRRKRQSQILQSLIKTLDDTVQEQIIFEKTELGLRVQILDDFKQRIFDETDQTGLTRTGKRVLNILGSAIVELDLPINLVAHSRRIDTQAGAAFTVWESSAKKALDVFAYLQGIGISHQKFSDIAGYGDRELRDLSDPYSFVNDRVSFEVLL